MLDDFRDDEELDKGDEFLDEFRQRLNSQPIENLEERKNDINRSQHIFLGTVLGVGLAGIVSCLKNRKFQPLQLRNQKLRLR